MPAPEAVLPYIFQRLLPYLNASDVRKVLAVRWFNRLYFDVEKWNQDFITLLRTFPRGGRTASKQRLADFDKKLDHFTQALEGRWTAEKWDLCCNLRMLSARFARDFAWLEKEDRECYLDLRCVIDEAYGNENTIVDQAKRVTYEVRNHRRQGDAEYKKITDLIDDYVQESQRAIDELQRVAERAGVQLLTLEQYQLALDTNGSLDARLLVLGDITMGHKIQATGNAITIIESNLSNVVQTIGSAPGIEKSAKDELSLSAQNGPG